MQNSIKINILFFNPIPVHHPDIKKGRDSSLSFLVTIYHLSFLGLYHFFDHIADCGTVFLGSQVSIGLGQRTVPYPFCSLPTAMYWKWKKRTFFGASREIFSSV